MGLFPAMLDQLGKLFGLAAGRLAGWTAVGLFPVAVAFGGSTGPLNWGPGVAMLGAMLAGIMLSDVRASRHRDRTGRNLLMAALSLLAARAALGGAAGAALREVLLMAVALGGWFIGSGASSKVHRRLMAGLALTCLANAVLCGIQRAHPEFSPVYPGRAGTYPSGLFAHYNHLAAFSLGAGGMLVGRLKGRGWAPLLVRAAALLACLFCVVTSLSRGGNLALFGILALAGLIVGLRSFVRGWHARLMVIAAAVALSVGLPLGIEGLGTVADSRGPNGQEFLNDGGRGPLWHAAAKLALERPLWGHGPGGFTREVYRVSAPGELLAEPGMAHNEWLQVACDYGLPAASLLLLAVAFPIGRTLIEAIGRGVMRPSRLGEALGLAAMLLQSNFSFFFHTAPCVLLAAMLLGRISRGSAPRVAGTVGEDAAEVHREAAETYYQQAARAKKAGREREAACGYALACIAGRPRAELRLLVLLLNSDCPRWRRWGEHLWLANEASDRVEVLRLARRVASATRNRRGWRWPGRLLRVAQQLAVLVFALILLGCGSLLTAVQWQAWQVIYRPDLVLPGGRVAGLLEVHETLPCIGLQRELLAVLIERTLQFETLAGREAWIDAYYRRILDSDIDSAEEPAVALQMAFVAGWAGDLETAMDFHQRATKLQAGHENIHMAHFYHAEYLIELAVSRLRDPADPPTGSPEIERLVALAGEELATSRKSAARASSAELNLRRDHFLRLSQALSEQFPAR